jgi:hypothetical protein
MSHVHALKNIHTVRFIMFSLITNIYNKKTKGLTLMELFTATRKLVFFDNQRCSMCATRMTRHTADTIFKFLPHMRQHGCIDILHFCNDPCLKAPMLMRVWQELEYRIDVCRVTCGAQTVVKKLVFLWL